MGSGKPLSFHKIYMPIIAHQTLRQNGAGAQLRQINIYLKKGYNGNLTVYRKKKSR